jgi:hypothetical protein
MSGIFDIWDSKFEILSDFGKMCISCGLKLEILFLFFNFYLLTQNQYTFIKFIVPDYLQLCYSEI